MKLTRRITTLLLALIMVLSMVACGKTEPSATEPAATEPAATDAAVGYVDPYADLREDHDALSETRSRSAGGYVPTVVPW